MKRIATHREQVRIIGGKLRPFAVTTAVRSPLLPDVAAIAQQGYPGYEASNGLENLSAHADSAPHDLSILTLPGPGVTAHNGANVVS